MAVIKAFCGPAGSGKTYALVAATKLAAGDHRWKNGQCLLALSFMHGSRRRLNSRLADTGLNGRKFVCETIDSFCLQTVNRYRQYVGRDLPVTISMQMEGESWERREREWRASVAAVRQAVVQLLAVEWVCRSVSASYPLIVVDEFQDCQGDLLAIIQGLAKSSSLLVAADPFQLLESGEVGCEAVEWLLGVCEVSQLAQIRRTENAVLLATAVALRDAAVATSSVPVLTPNGPGLVAWEISSRLAWGRWSQAESKALISPVRHEGCPWVASVLKSLSGLLGKRTKIGPFPFRWEATDKERRAGMQAKLPQGSADTVSLAELKGGVASENYVVRQSCKSALRLLSVRGCPTINSGELGEIADRCLHSVQAYGREGRIERTATTVHGAKNREFDHVVVLWPHAVGGDPLYRRKLLYNAITRARKTGVVIVQGGVQRVRADPVLTLLFRGLVIPTLGTKHP
jgi:hypothetical protein